LTHDAITGSTPHSSTVEVAAYIVATWSRGDLDSAALTASGGLAVCSLDSAAGCNRHRCGFGPTLGARGLYLVGIGIGFSASPSCQLDSLTTSVVGSKAGFNVT